jgi:hypothetical protein
MEIERDIKKSGTKSASGFFLYSTPHYLIQGIFKFTTLQFFSDYFSSFLKGDRGIF